jgi:hypothetical protein
MKLALLAVLLVACGSKDEPAPAAPASAPAKRAAAQPPAPAQAGPVHDLAALKVTLPAGWQKEWSKDTGQWIFTSPKIPDGRVVYARISRAGHDMPTTPEAWIQNRVEHHWDKGVTGEVVTKEDRPGGFAATVKVTVPMDAAHPKHEYYAAWDVPDVGGDKLYCECEWVPDDAIRDQIAALCKSAAF